MSTKNLIEGEDFQTVTPADNGLFTVRTLNTNSPSNNGLLEDFQNVDSIPVIPISTNSCFDKNNLPKIETLDSLLSNLCELMIRFDGCVKDYQKADFEHLIKTLSNSLINLYTASNKKHTIQQDGVDLVERKNLNFVGTTVTDDPINDATIVEIPTISYSDTSPVDPKLNDIWISTLTLIQYQWVGVWVNFNLQSLVNIDGIDGGTSTSIFTSIIDGGTSTTTQSNILDGGNAI